MIVSSLGHPLLPTSFSIPAPKTIHRSLLTVSLPDSLDLDPLSIDFVLDKRPRISWFPRLRFCGRCRNLEFTIQYDYEGRPPCSSVLLLQLVFCCGIVSLHKSVLTFFSGSSSFTV